MAEWWNVDQALIWMVTRDARLVALAAGDAGGGKDRQTSYIDHMDLTAKAPEAGEEEFSEGPIATLMQMLESEKFSSRDANIDSADLIVGTVFNRYQCVITVPKNTMSLRTVTWPFRWLAILISADSVRTEFPPNVPLGIQDGPTAPEATLPIPGLRKGDGIKKQRSQPKRAEAMRGLSLAYPEGIPKGTGITEITNRANKALGRGADGIGRFTMKRAMEEYERKRSRS